MAQRLQMLKGIVVVDLAVGMAPALVSKFLAELGAKVIRVEPPEGDPFGDYYPAYDVWRRATTLDAEAQRSPQRLDALLADADVCIIGGEDHPEVKRRSDASALSARHPRLVVLDIEAAPPGTEHAGKPATDVLAQARSGLCYEHYTDRPIVMSFEPANYGAALRGIEGILAALYEREGSGRGQTVATSLFEGAMFWCAGMWCEVDNPTPGTNFIIPKDPYPLIFPCSDGVYIHIAIGAAGSKYKFYKALEIDDPTVGPNDSGMPKPTGDPKNFYGDVDLLAAHAAKLPSDVLLQRIWEMELPGEPILPPGKCWDEPQVRHNGIIETDADGTRHVGQPISSAASAAARKTPAKTGRMPLEGVRVVDFGSFVAGPYASQVLADLGADVIKVETLSGDPNRGISRSYTPTNRGKRAISVDLKSDEGIAIARDLCRDADVVANNFRAGVSHRLGIDPESLHASKPDLVVLESPAYGSSGPLATRGGFDMVIQALCGHEYRGGGKNNVPLWNRTSMVDYAGGFLGALGCLAALLHRARTGEGVSLDSPLLGSGIFLLSELVQRPGGRFEGAEPLNATRTGYRAAEALYQTRDGWIAIAARGRKAAAALAEVLGLAGKLGDNPLAWDDAAATSIAAAVRQRESDALLAALQAAGVWADKCRQGAEHAMLNDAALRAAGAVRQGSHPKYGAIREIGAMLRFSRSVAGHPGHAPLLGESTRELLSETKRGPADIEALYERKVVG